MWRRTQLGRPGTYSIDTFSHMKTPFTPAKRKIATNSLLRPLLDEDRNEVPHRRPSNA
jgi:hypothetical protein